MTARDSKLETRAMVGTWRLVSMYAVVTETGTRAELHGDGRQGYAIIEPGGRMMAMLTAKDREAATSDAGLADLFRSMTAYTGKWRVEGDLFVTTVDMAWDPNWIGTEQARFFKIDGDRNVIRSAPIAHPSFPGSKIVVHAEWQRES